MLVRREKIITTFKVISIVLLAYMIVDFYSAIKNEIPNTKFDNSDQEFSLNIQKMKTSLFGIAERNSICEQISKEKEVDSNVLLQSSVYYSFAIFLGAFINAKKIMIIGVI